MKKIPFLSSGPPLIFSPLRTEEITSFLFFGGGGGGQGDEQRGGGEHCLLGRLSLKWNSWFYSFADCIIIPPVALELWGLQRSFRASILLNTHQSLGNILDSLKGISSFTMRKQCLKEIKLPAHGHTDYHHHLDLNPGLPGKGSLEILFALDSNLRFRWLYGPGQEGKRRQLGNFGLKWPSLRSWPAPLWPCPSN